VIWAVAMFVAAIAVLSLCYLHSTGRLRRKPLAPALLVEMEAMQTAARIQAMTNAAEDHMDRFIRERRQYTAPQWPQADSNPNNAGRPW
jgi:hypothetical protein